MSATAKSIVKPLALTSIALSLGLAVSGCAEASQSEPSPTATAENTTTPEDSVDPNAIHQTIDKISAALGDDFVQAWSENGTVHVSTTNDQALSTIEELGGVGHVVEFTSDEVREGIGKIMAWQGSQAPEISGAIHAYSLNPQTGGITLSVDPAYRTVVEEALNKDKPAGDIPLDFKNSAGIASPASS